MGTKRRYRRLLMATCCFFGAISLPAEARPPALSANEIRPPGVGQASSGDFNGDSIADFVATPNRLLLGDGSGGFTTTPLARNFSEVEATDVDIDGHDDFVGISNGIRVYRGNGDGTFAESGSYQTAKPTQMIEILDVNGDTLVDIVAAGDGVVTVFVGNGLGEFTKLTTVDAMHGVVTLDHGDLDGDGDQDLAASGVDAVWASDGNSYKLHWTALLFMNVGGGAFTQEDYTIGPHPRVAVGKMVASSGRSQLVVTDAVDETVSVFDRTGSMELNEVSSTGVGPDPRSAVLRDLDGDGAMDALVTNGVGSDISILHGSGTGELNEVQSVPTYHYAPPPAVADMNSDGHPDLLVGEVSSIMGRTGGRFRVPPFTAVGDEPGGPATGDWNGDGKGDLATANLEGSSISVLTSTTPGDFDRVDIETGEEPTDLESLDSDDDGDADLALARYTDGVVTLFENQDGVFGESYSYEVFPQIEKLLVGDFNADGYDDLVALKYRSGETAILFGNGDGSLREGPTPQLPRPLVAADLLPDHPGDELASRGVYGEAGAYEIDILSCAESACSVRRTVPIQQGMYELLTGDFDSDGFEDLAYATTHPATGEIGTVLSDGGLFRDERLTFHSRRLDWEDRYMSSDIDADGRDDIVMVSKLRGTMSFFAGAGNGQFDSARRFAVGRPSDEPLAIADVDANGRDDILVAIAPEDGVRAFLNSTPTANSPPSAAGLPWGDSPTEGELAVRWTVSVDGEEDALLYTLQHRDADDTTFTTAHTTVYPRWEKEKAPEGTWTFRVKAWDGRLESPYSTPSEEIKIDRSAPPAPIPHPARAPEHVAAGKSWWRDSVVISWEFPQDGELQDGSPGSGRSSQATGSSTAEFPGENLEKEWNFDLVGNHVSTTFPAYIDKKDPVVTSDCPETPLIRGEDASVSWTARDGGSGMATPTDGTIDLDTDSVGVFAADLPIARDNVGHETAVKCHYRVNHSWRGFLPPAASPEPDGYVHVVENGGRVQIPFDVGGFQGRDIVRWEAFSEDSCRGYQRFTWKQARVKRRAGLHYFRGRETYAWVRTLPNPPYRRCFVLELGFDDAEYRTIRFLVP